MPETPNFVIATFTFGASKACCFMWKLASKSWIQEQYSKTCVKWPLSKRPKISLTNYRLMQVKCIAECSKRSILQYFRPSISYLLLLSSFFVYFWVAVLHRFYCTEHLHPWIVQPNPITSTWKEDCIVLVQEMVKDYTNLSWVWGWGIEIYITRIPIWHQGFSCSPFSYLFLF